MAIVKITIDTDKIGEAPKLKVNGKHFKVIKHINFNYDTATDAEKSVANLTVDTWPNHIKELAQVDINKAVSHEQSWHTAWQHEPYRTRRAQGKYGEAND